MTFGTKWSRDRANWVGGSDFVPGSVAQGGPNDHKKNAHTRKNSVGHHVDRVIVGKKHAR